MICMSIGANIPRGASAKQFCLEEDKGMYIVPLQFREDEDGKRCPVEVDNKLYDIVIAYNGKDHFTSTKPIHPDMAYKFCLSSALRSVEMAKYWLDTAVNYHEKMRGPMEKAIKDLNKWSTQQVVPWTKEKPSDSAQAQASTSTGN